MKTPKIIHINGRRWFDRKNGNTYHSAVAWLDGMHAFTETFQYGYGGQYIQTVQDWLETQGWKFERYSSGMKQDLESFCHENNIKLVTDVADVGRKGDL